MTEAIWLRPELVRFSSEMELKLRKHDGKKTHWRDQPIEALVRLLKLEISEFDVADEFFTVKEARTELIDIANYALILHDRLEMINQDKNRHEQAAPNGVHGIVHMGGDGHVHKGYVNECAICSKN